MRNLKKVFALCSLALAFTVMFTNASFAGGVMNYAVDKAVTMFNHIKMIIFVIGGFGLVGIAFQAIFGKVKWTWFAGLAVGLGILAAAGAIVNYASGARMGDGTVTTNVVDTFAGAGAGLHTSGGGM